MIPGNIGAWELLAAAVIIAFIWFRNFWPEWALYRLGKTLGIPQADLLAKQCVRERLLMVRDELQQQYIAFFYRTFDLVYAIPDPMLREELEWTIRSVSGHGNPDPATWSTVTEVLERIADSGALSVIARGIALRAQGYDLEDLFARYYRIERRLGLPEVEKSA